MKKIMKFEEFEKVNEGAISTIIGCYFLYKFIMGILKKHIFNKPDMKINDIMQTLKELVSKNDTDDKVLVTEINDRYFIRSDKVDSKLPDIRLYKDKNLHFKDKKGVEITIQLSDKEYTDLLQIIKDKI